MKNTKLFLIIFTIIFSFSSFKLFAEFVNTTRAGIDQPNFIAELNVSQTTNDASTYSIISPCANGCGLTSTETVKIGVANLGSDTINNLIVSFKLDNNPAIFETIGTAILPDDSIVYSFLSTVDLSLTGNYSIICATHLPADSYSFNDTLIKNFTINNSNSITSFPYLQNFETTNDWISNGINNSWTLDSLGFTNFVLSYGSTPISYSPESKHMHTISMWNYENSYLESPCFDFSNLSYPIFEMKLLLLLYSPNNSYSYPGDNTVWLEYSIDGINFETLGSINSGENWYDPDTNTQYQNAWVCNKFPQERVSHDLAFLAGEATVKFRIKCVMTSFYSDSYVSVDDIFIFDKPEIDAGIIEFPDISELDCGLTNSNEISISIKNFGTQAISNFMLGAISDFDTITELFADTIFPSDTIIFTFSNNMNLSDLGTINLKAWATVSGDYHNSNDTFNYEVFHLPYIENFPYIDNFDSSEIYWTTGGQYSTWSYNQNAFTQNSYEIVAYSDSNFWHTNIAQSVESTNEESWVMSPCFNFSNLSNPMIELQIMQIMDWDNHVWIEASSDNGENWQKIGQTGDIFNWYTEYFGQTDAWYGEMDYEQNAVVIPWHTVQHSLSNFAGEPLVKIRICFSGMVFIGNNNFGFAFDDIKIYDRPQYDIGILDILLGDDCELSYSQEIPVKIYNGGQNPISGFTVSYQINGGAWVNEIFADTLAPDSIMIYNFNTLANLGATGEHTIAASVNFPSDGFLHNDSLEAKTINSLSFDFVNMNPYLTYFEWIDTYEGYLTEGWTILNADTNTNNWLYDYNESISYYHSYRLSYVNNATSFDDYLISRCFQLDSGKQYQIKFWLKSNSFNSSFEIVYGTSADISGLSNQIASFSSFNPVGFNEYIADFSVSTDDVYYIAFHAFGNSNSGDIIYIDDFSIEEFSSFDAKISSISLSSTCQLDSNEIINIEITNAGFQSISGIPVVCTINDTLTITDTYSDTILAGQTVPFSFSSTANLSMPSIYFVKAWTILVNDLNIQNDTITAQFSSFPTISSFPNTEDFESEHYWTTGGIKSSWGLGTISETEYPTSSSSSNMFFTHFNGEANQYEVSWVESPCYDISNLSYPYVEFDIFSANQDNVTSFQYSIDGGQSWIQLGSLNSGQYWYNENLQYYLYFLDMNFSCSAGWKKPSYINDFSLFLARHSLAEIVGANTVKFRFVYATYTFNNPSEVFGFDNFKVYDRITGCIDPYANNYNPLAVVSDYSCTYNCFADATYEITNLGYNTYMFNLVTPLDSVYSILWDFGNTDQAYGDSVIYTYPLPININTSCSVYLSMDNSCYDDYNILLYATECALNANFSVTEVDSGEYIFELLYPEFVQAASTVWDFGDGTTISGVDSVYHKYDTIGNYLMSCSREMIYGSYCNDYIDTLLNVSAVSHEYQFFTFTSGWNMFSTYLIPLEPDFPSALSNWTNLTLVKNSIGQIFWPLYGINQIPGFDIGFGYQNNLSDNSVYYLQGYPVIPELSAIELNEGWQILGYLRKTPADISLMTLSITNSMIIIKDENGFVYWPLYQINAIGDMAPGKAYQIKMLNIDTLYYPPN